MSHPNHTLPRYRDEDHHLLDLDQLSKQARVSRAFLRLCLATGCPSESGRLSQAMLLDWLFENYEAVRAAAGLAPLHPPEGLTGLALRKLKLGNAVLTLLEFSASRAFRPGEKRHLENTRAAIERALDRA
jgi:hypothetical protein